MSKDIRSYFSRSNGSSKTKPSQISPQTKKRNHRVIESDDDDDDVIVIKKKPNEQPIISKSEKKKPEVVIQVENFFGNKPVQQKKQMITAKLEATHEKKPAAKKSRKKNENKILDLSFENDDELEASLLQTSDEQLLSWEKKKSEESKTPKKDAILERTQSKSPKVIQKCEGQVLSSVSRKTDIILREEPQALKNQKPQSFGTREMHEDELLNMNQGGSNSGGSIKKKETDNFVKITPEKTTSKYFSKDGAKKRVEKLEEVKKDSKKIKLEKKPDKPDVESKCSFNKAQEIEPSRFKEIEKKSGDMLWVDKYRPKSTKTIIGQMGEKSNVRKLIKWLQNWHKNHSNKEGKKPARPAPWTQNDDGSYFKAVLLSGPPGVGKTTTVHLVCEELGMDIIEFNASDTRSKNLLQEEVSELLSNRSIRGFFQGSGENYQKHVLVMDEVDGMAGNEDRGGVQELIQLIKHTKVPIIGICNDRNHPKMRSLVNYCFDLRFQRPRVEQIKGAMKSICFKENFEISGEALEELIISSNHDLRQVLHNLSMLAMGHKSISLEEAKRKGEQAKKPLSLSPWDVVRKVFSASEQEKMSFTDKMDLFFQDYSLGPLFVQDTYLRVKPYKAKNSEKKKLQLISKAADSLALGDIVERAIRTQNAWSLLPVQAIFSSVLPGYHMSGHVQGQVQFPVWLGKNSRTNKMDRLLQELHSSLRMNVTGTKQAINLDYLNRLKDAIVKPLVQEGSQGVRVSLEFMLNYHLTREDLDCILELSTWPGLKDTFSQVDSKVKAALTRALNKECQMTVSKKSTKVKADDNLDLEEVEEEETEEREADDVGLDPMIKVGKSKVIKDPEHKGKTKEEKKKGNSKKETKRGKK